MRQGIHAYVHGHPDSRFEEIRRTLGLSRGALSFHLRVLEREGYLVSRTHWARRAFRTVGSVPRADAGDVATRILAQLAERDMGAAELATTLGLSRQLARYHLLGLQRAGLVEASGSGRHVRYRPASADRNLR